MSHAVDQSAELATPGIWDQYLMAVDRVTQRMARITSALDAEGVDYAIVGGQAVALWVASRNPAAVRTTKNVDLLVRRDDLAGVRKASLAAGFDYFETLGVGMLLDRQDPNPRHAVHLVWAGEIARPLEIHAMPPVQNAQIFDGKWRAVALLDLVTMKLIANRDQDRVHLRDMIDVGLVDRELSQKLPTQLQPLLDRLLTDSGR